MKGISALKAGAASAAILAIAGFSVPACAADGTSQSPTVSQQDYDALVKRVESLETELQASEVRAAKDHDAVSSWKPSTGWWNDTKLSGRMYYDITSLDEKSDGVKSTNTGTSFDFKRFYVGIDHTFNDTFAANVTTDVSYDSTTGVTKVYIKKAYADVKLDKALDIRFGSTDMPWIPYAEGVYGMRYVEHTIADRVHYGTSADWGIHIKGDLGHGFDYGMAITTGAGYKKAIRTKQPDFEGRIGFRHEGLTLAIGGKVGLNGVQHGTKTYNTAGRFNALAAYDFKNTSLKGLKLGVEYFYATDYTQVKSTTHTNAYGVSPFASYDFTPKWKVFGRYDYVSPYSDKTRKDTKENYFNIGVSYSPTKIVDFALVYKYDKVEDGYVHTDYSGISVSSATTGYEGKASEIGLWGRVRW